MSESPYSQLFLVGGAGGKQKAYFSSHLRELAPPIYDPTCYVVPMKPPLNLVLGPAWQVLQQTTFIISILLEKKRRKRHRLAWNMPRLGLACVLPILYLAGHHKSYSGNSLVQTHTFDALFHSQASPVTQDRRNTAALGQLPRIWVLCLRSWWLNVHQRPADQPVIVPLMANCRALGTRYPPRSALASLTDVLPRARLIPYLGGHSTLPTLPEGWLMERWIFSGDFPTRLVYVHLFKDLSC